MALALTLAAIGKPSQAHALVGYNCVNPHCYAEYDWEGGVDGGVTEITAVPIYAMDFYDKMSDEIWVFQYYGSSCNNSGNSNGYCWVEAGFYGVGASCGNTSCASSEYVWADNRPNAGYYEHDIAPVPSGDYNHPTQFDILQNGYNVWDIYMFGQTWSYTSGVSVNSITNADSITAGAELQGNGSVPPDGVQAPRADFTNNEYMVGGNFYYQNYHNYNPGSGFAYLSPAPPPYGSVVSQPNGSTNAGGDFYTDCCI